MNVQAWSSKRRLVPRWRSLDQTARAGELTAVYRGAPRKTWEVSPELSERMAEWRRSPNLLSAADLVESAIVEGKEDAAVHAARRLYFIERNAAPLIRSQAAGLLARTGYGSELAEQPPRADQSQIAFWRARTRLNPRDALSWVELSLRQTINGNLGHAARSMSVGLQLAAENRHVLRSAARLYLHLGDPQRAHDLVARSAATPGDPWLMAAEISLAELASSGTAFGKSARRLLDDGGLRHRLTTELAGALATAELRHGSVKPAKKLFAMSMIDPTGNALAQAEWASPFVGSTLVPAGRFTSVDEASEANAFHFFRTHNFAEVTPACERWAAEEPYSIRPYEFGAAVAAYDAQYGVAEDFALRGLKMRAGSPILVNSLVFALACDNRLDEAESALAGLDASIADEATLRISTANRGLIAFRRGRSAEGRVLYQDVINGFRRAGEKTSELTGKLYFAREAMRAGEQDAPTLAEEAVKAWKQFHGDLHHPVLAELRGGNLSTGSAV